MGAAQIVKTGLWESNKSVTLLDEAEECCTLDGESPVAESITSLCSDQSSMGHEMPKKEKRKCHNSLATPQ